MITSYNSLEEIFCTGNTFITALAKDAMEYAENIISYKVFPTLLFYENCKGLSVGAKYIYPQKDVQSIKKFDNVISKQYKKELYNIKSNINKLENNSDNNDNETYNKNKENTLTMALSGENIEQFGNKNFGSDNDDQDLLNLEEFNFADTLSCNNDSITIPTTNKSMTK